MSALTLGQHWEFTTAAGECREYEIEHIADQAESPGRRVRLRRLGTSEDAESYASVYEGWMHEGSRPGAEGRWSPAGAAA